MIGLDKSEICRDWRTILRISCESSWLFFTRPFLYFLREGNLPTPLAPFSSSCFNVFTYGYIFILTQLLTFALWISRYEITRCQPGDCADIWGRNDKHFFLIWSPDIHCDSRSSKCVALCYGTYFRMQNVFKFRAVTTYFNFIFFGNTSWGLSLMLGLGIALF